GGWPDGPARGHAYSRPQCPPPGPIDRCEKAAWDLEVTATRPMTPCVWNPAAPSPARDNAFQQQHRREKPLPSSANLRARASPRARRHFLRDSGRALSRVSERCPLPGREPKLARVAKPCSSFLARCLEPCGQGQGSCENFRLGNGASFGAGRRAPDPQTPSIARKEIRAPVGCRQRNRCPTRGRFQECPPRDRVST